MPLKITLPSTASLTYPRAPVEFGKVIHMYIMLGHRGRRWSSTILCIVYFLQLRLYCYHMFGYSVRDASLPLQIVLYVAAFIVKNLLLLYPLVTFMLLDWAQCYKVSVCMCDWGRGWNIVNDFKCILNCCSNALQLYLLYRQYFSKL